ncbi:something about silencing, SAS, complex subunit 4-domain-containing protein [Aspergillus granulosus]|uniref:Something about silencing, SAS, complex subunit 4-domain-containing protein n=1 Tax=Aspergillus granulosus TaxID=176169 RepID=A0ABR4GU96_9EURO
MLRTLLISATAVGAGSIAAFVYVSNWKQSLASKIIHSSQRGQIPPSTPRNISSLPSDIDIFSSKYFVLYDYASISTPRNTLPDLDPSALLTMLLRRNMSSFASSPQARILKFMASDPETQQSFDANRLRNLDFKEGDLVCNAYQIKLRTEDKAEFELKFGVQGRLVVRAEVRGDDVIFHNETIMWRERESKSKLPLERGLAQWVHELTAAQLPSFLYSLLFPGSPMTSTAIMAVRSRSSLRVLRSDPNDAGENSVQPPPTKRPRLHRPTTSRRQGSSPDLLDTTIETPPSSSSTKLRRPRPLFALSSAHPTSSPPPHAGTPRARNLRVHHHDTPTSTHAALYLNGGRESPDPLDTISPAPTVTFKTTPKPSNTPTSAAYRQRRITQFLKPATEPVAIPEPPKPKTPRVPKGNAAPTPPEDPVSVPTATATADGAMPEKRRSLRSHDGGSRVRSELALYFPNYEELMSLEPPKTEFLTGNTTIKLINDLHEPPIPPSAFSGPDVDTPFGNPLVNLHGCETITLPDPPAQVSDDARSGAQPSNEKHAKEGDEDPLNEEVYFKAHRRHERQEKQLRNIERDRAQHEKQQLDRLLDELQSQEWLRVMGITGRSLTDQEKKLYEPKRDYFIKEISALLQKFKIWKEEEKRRKLDKDHKSASFHSDGAEAASHAKDKDAKSDDEADDDQIASEPPPDINDVDALAAHQLLQEARSATAGKRPSKSKPEPEPLPPPPAEPEKPFTSFFSKPHLREAAMSGNRKGRTRLAFGLPIPDVEEKEFELPDDILTADAIKSCQRKRRRIKRGGLGGD